MGSRTRKVPVSRLDLNLENPRLIEPAGSQDEAMQALVAHSPKDMQSLVKHIASAGELSPLDPMCVVADGKRFKVLEGNRRLTALRLLLEPAKAPESIRASVARAAKAMGSAKLVELPVVVVDHESEAQPWIRLKHSGAGTGAGVSSWNPAEKARHEAAITGRSTFHDLVLRAVETWYGDDENLVAQAREVRRTQYTNFERLIRTQHVKKGLGLSKRDQTVRTLHPPAELKPFFAALFTALLTPRPEGAQPWSREWARTQDRVKWFEEQPSRPGPPAPDATPAVAFDATAVTSPSGAQPRVATQEPLDPSLPQGETSAPRTGKPARRAAPSQARYLDAKGFVVHDMYSRAVRELFDEIITIDISQFSNVTLDAYRTFVELTIKDYAHLQDDTVEAKRTGAPVMLDDLLRWLGSHVNSNPRLKSAYGQTLKRIVSRQTPWHQSVQALNAANHDATFCATPSIIEDVWSAPRELLRDLLSRGPEAP